MSIKFVLFSLLIFLLSPFPSPDLSTKSQCFIMSSDVDRSLPSHLLVYVETKPCVTASWRYCYQNVLWHRRGRLWCFFASRSEAARSYQQACFVHASGDASVAVTKLLPQNPGQFDVENKVLSHPHFYKHVKKMPDKHKGTECLFLVQIQS